MKKLVLFLFNLLIVMNSWAAIQGWCIFNNDVPYAITSPTTVKVYGSQYTNLSGDVVIPSTIVDVDDGKIYSVTSVGESAFYGQENVISVTLPSSVTSIGDRAFQYCHNLTSVNIPSLVTSIGDNAFCGCEKLSSVDIPSSVESIGDNAFTSCTKLTSVNIPSSVTSIGEDAFYFCTSLTSVTIPNSVTRIGASAFNFCTSLTSVAIPNSVDSILDNTFSGCSGLASVKIPNSVRSIGYSAFAGCDSLTSVEIPSSVTSMGKYAFLCKNLDTVYSYSVVPPSIDEECFISADAFFCYANLYVPTGSKTAYEYATGWKDFLFSTEIYVPASVQEERELGVNLFVNNGELFVDGVVPETRIAVYKIDGVLVVSQMLTGNNFECALPKKGLYIVRVGNESIKVLY